MGSSDSLHQHDENLNSSTIQLFNNNPPLPNTQRYDDFFVVILKIEFFVFL
jgi:hypothetical protein